MPPVQPSEGKAGRGPAVRHAAWHPLSGNHLLTLGTDNIIRVYNTSNSMEEPEQAIELCGRALLEDPFEHAIRYNRAAYLARLGRLDRRPRWV